MPEETRIGKYTGEEGVPKKVYKPELGNLPTEEQIKKFEDWIKYEEPCFSS